MIYTHITDMIGNTPLLHIPEHIHNIPRLLLYAKLEYQNPFGSLKDRFAWYGIKDHVQNLSHNPQAKILESSSWNTSKAIAGIANTFGIATKTITNRIKVQEQKDMLTLLWVDIEQLPSTGECIDLSERNNAVELIEQACARNNNYLHTDQYRNNLNTQAHIDGTWPEIYRDLWAIDYFFGSLWTTGSSWWVTKYLREKNAQLISVGIVSDADDFIPWIRNKEEMNEVGIFDKSLYQHIIEVNSSAAISTTIALMKNTWIMWWPTSGAVYTWLCTYFEKNSIPAGTQKIWVFIVCDRIEPYMSYIKQRIPELFHQEHKYCILKITPQDQEKHAKMISSLQLKKLVDAHDPNLFLLDTRHNLSYKLWHISWSINLELNLLTEITDKWTLCDKHKKIILLCPFGKQTKKLCAYLNMSWFDAYSLEWWLQAWKQQWNSFIIEQ